MVFNHVNLLSAERVITRLATPRADSAVSIVTSISDSCGGFAFGTVHLWCVVDDGITIAFVTQVRQIKIVINFTDRISIWFFRLGPRGVKDVPVFLKFLPLASALFDVWVKLHVVEPVKG